MYVIRQNFISPIIFNIVVITTVCLCIPPVWGGSPVDMGTYYKKEEIGLALWADGKSMIDDDRLKKESTIHIGHFAEVFKIILIWSGETKKEVKDYNFITVKTPKKDEKIVKADKVYNSSSTGNLYACIADITSLYSGKGKYTVKNLKTDKVIKKGGKSVFSVGGYAVVVVYKDPEITARRLLLVKTNLLVLRPGEIHECKIFEKNNSRVLQTMVVIGGHGLKGNASANLINGQSISGGEDWDGSSGRYWDVDSFSNNVKNIDIKNGLTLGFDSLLQWIYPVSVIVILE